MLLRADGQCFIKYKLLCRLNRYSFWRDNQPGLQFRNDVILFLFVFWNTGRRAKVDFEFAGLGVWTGFEYQAEIVLIPGNDNLWARHLLWQTFRSRNPFFSESTCGSGSKQH